MSSLVTVSRVLTRRIQSAQVLDDAGWLPHYSTPFDRVDECDGDVEALRELLWQHYQERWPEVRKGIESRLMRYEVDDEAKATFFEALAAHQAGLYRSVCRVLMLEIERVSRKELHGDAIGNFTRQKLLCDLAAQLPISSVEPGGFYGLVLFKRLSEHLYQGVRDDEARQRFARDPIPNRHAAVHGLVVYSSKQNSLNVMFMADFVFQVIASLKRLKIEQADR
ncbi:MAG: hypothetical protein OXN89_14355 [Bryobacterales bacterium]|nr:hypothetical protein [Bryobacterales bacterium]